MRGVLILRFYVGELREVRFEEGGFVKLPQILSRHFLTTCEECKFLWSDMSKIYFLINVLKEVIQPQPIGQTNCSSPY